MWAPQPPKTRQINLGFPWQKGKEDLGEQWDAGRDSLWDACGCADPTPQFPCTSARGFLALLWGADVILSPSSALSASRRNWGGNACPRSGAGWLEMEQGPPGGSQPAHKAAPRSHPAPRRRNKAARDTRTWDDPAGQSLRAAAPGRGSSTRKWVRAGKGARDLSQTTPRLRGEVAARGWHGEAQGMGCAPWHCGVKPNLTPCTSDPTQQSCKLLPR